jgi:hypothetical protein
MIKRLRTHSYTPEWEQALKCGARGGKARAREHDVTQNGRKILNRIFHNQH